MKRARSGSTGPRKRFRKLSEAELHQFFADKELLSEVSSVYDELDEAGLCRVKHIRPVVPMGGDEGENAPFPDLHDEEVVTLPMLLSEIAESADTYSSSSSSSSSSLSSSSSSSTSLAQAVEAFVSHVRGSLQGGTAEGPLHRVIATADGETATVSLLSSSFAAASSSASSPEVPDDDFTCNICFDSNVPLTERHWLRGGGGCAHAFCKGCVRGWLTVRVGEGEIHFSCPLAFVATSPEATTNGNGNSLGCTAMACEEDLVASGCSPETVAAYRRYQRLRGPGGDRLRDCPSCGSLVAATAWNSRVRCPECRHVFCRDHLDAHAGRSCLVYAWESRRRATELTEGDRVVSASTKPCPRCTAPTVRISGCNHMQCPRCVRAPPNHQKRSGGGGGGGGGNVHHNNRNGEAISDDELDEDRFVHPDYDDEEDDEEGYYGGGSYGMDTCHWCWLCGMELDSRNVDDHYGPDGPCSGLQFGNAGEGGNGNGNGNVPPNTGNPWRYLVWAANAPGRPAALQRGSAPITKACDYVNFVVFVLTILAVALPCLVFVLLYGLTFWLVHVPTTFLAFMADPTTVDHSPGVDAAQRRKVRLGLVVRRLLAYWSWGSRGRYLDLATRFLRQRPYPVATHTHLSPAQAAEQLLTWSEWHVWARELGAHRFLADLSFASYLVPLFAVWSAHCWAWFCLVASTAAASGVALFPLGAAAAAVSSSDDTVAVVVRGSDLLGRLALSPLNAVRLLVFAGLGEADLPEYAWKVLLLAPALLCLALVALALALAVAGVLLAALVPPVAATLLHAGLSYAAGPFATDVAALALVYDVYRVSRAYGFGIHGFFSSKPWLATATQVIYESNFCYGNDDMNDNVAAATALFSNSSSSNGTCPYAADAVETSTLLGIDPSERLRVALYSKVIVPVQLVWLVALPFGLFATWLQMRAKPRYRIDVAVPGAVLGR
jgi:hypothetical protein